MPDVFPTIPEQLTVHLAAPATAAENVTVSFPDYVKNVVSSEIYPTWEREAILANTLAVISFALNRVYTEYYRSRGYAFDITASTSIDQKFIRGRNFFENIDEIVDEVFNSYLRRRGVLEPLAAKFCNGTTTTCEGLSQWGSQALALSGADSTEILQTYYGADIVRVDNAPIAAIEPSYPGTALRAGDLGADVSRIQVELNRISQSYPAIPKVTVNGIFDAATEQAVRAFQAIFELTVDGIVGQKTWYQLIFLYTGLRRLGELRAEGQEFDGFSWEYPESIVPGETGTKVTHLQYMLAVLAEFIPEISAPAITGTFGADTESAVRAFQTFAALPSTGQVDRETWDAIYAQYAGIRGTVFQDEELFPIRESAAASAFAARTPATDSAEAQRQDTTRFLQFPRQSLARGMRDQEAEL